MFKKLPIVFILTAATLWGTMGVFVRFLSSAGFTDAEKLLTRCVVSFVAMFVYMLFAKREAFQIRLRDIWVFIGTGVISLALFSLFYFYTLSNINVSIAAILLYTSPAFVICLSALFFKEKITLRKILALALTIVGCAFVSGIAGAAKIAPRFLVTGLMSGFCYALYSIFGTVALRRYASLTVTFYTFLFALVGVLPLIDFSHMGAALTSQSYMPLFMIFFGLVTGLLPYAFYTAGLARVEAGKAAVCAALEPVMAAVFAFLILHEAMSFSTFLGIVFVIGGIAVVSLQPKKVDCSVVKDA